MLTARHRKYNLSTPFYCFGGSVVVKDIPDNSIAVGNPCKVIKKIEPGKAREYNIGEKQI